MTTDRSWNIEEEITLLSLVCDFKPAGNVKDHNVSEILLRINEEYADGEKFTKEQIWAKLKQYFDLNRVDSIEQDLGEDREHDVGDDGDDTTSKESTISSKHPEEEKNGETSRFYTFESRSVLESDSSELSDVEGEETELEKFQHPDFIFLPRVNEKSRPTNRQLPYVESPAVASRGPIQNTTTSRKRARVPNKSEAPISKKRPSTPQPAKRKTRSYTPEVESPPIESVMVMDREEEKEKEKKEESEKKIKEEKIEEEKIEEEKIEEEKIEEEKIEEEKIEEEKSGEIKKEEESEEKLEEEESEEESEEKIEEEKSGEEKSEEDKSEEDKSESDDKSEEKSEKSDESDSISSHSTEMKTEFTEISSQKETSAVEEKVKAEGPKKEVSKPIKPIRQGVRRSTRNK